MTELPGLVRRGPATDPLRVLLSGNHSAGDVGGVDMEMTPGSGGPPLPGAPRMARGHTS